MRKRGRTGKKMQKSGRLFHFAPTDRQGWLCYQAFLPETRVTGPCILLRFCLVKFLTRHRITVVLPTFGGPTTATMYGGGSNGVRSTTGI